MSEWLELQKIDGTIDNIDGWAPVTATNIFQTTAFIPITWISKEYEGSPILRGWSDKYLASKRKTKSGNLLLNIISF